VNGDFLVSSIATAVERNALPRVASYDLESINLVKKFPESSTRKSLKVFRTRAGVLSQLVDLICAVDTHMGSSQHPVRAAIDGVDGAGKTTLADELALLIKKYDHPVIRASVDGFHNPKAIRYRCGWDSPEGYYRDSFNYEALLRELLVPLGPGGDRRYRRVNFELNRDAVDYETWREAPANAVLLFDGVFLLRPELIQDWDFSIFLDVDFCISVPRAVQRDILNGDQKWNVNIIQARYKRRYVPGQQLYLREARPKEQASIIVDNNNYLNPVIVMK
jgi:uridine kinase